MHGHVELSKTYAEIPRVDEKSRRLLRGGAEESENDLVPWTYQRVLTDGYCG